MKRVLITGKNSYVGNNLEKWLAKFPEDYIVDKISLRNNEWKSVDFSVYDTIVHVAGIAHVSSKEKMEPLYYKVNRDLTYEVAKYAKKNKVKQFIFISSIIVYGRKSVDDGIINENTIPLPDNFYGKSKLEAENLLRTLEDGSFNLAIVRPPMIYGKCSKGNYLKLSKFARFSPVFPDYSNKRSMLYIDNLSEFLKLLIDREERGLFFPQNKEHVCTSEMVKLISETHGKKIYLTKAFNFIISKLKGNLDIVHKVFGDLVYDQSLSNHDKNYCIYDLKKSIELTERN